MIWGFPQKISVGPELGEVEGCVVENLNEPQPGYVLGTGYGGFLGNFCVGSELGNMVGFLVGNFQTGPDSAI